MSYFGTDPHADQHAVSLCPSLLQPEPAAMCPVQKTVAVHVVLWQCCGAMTSHDETEPVQNAASTIVVRSRASPLTRVRRLSFRAALAIIRTRVSIHCASPSCITTATCLFYLFLATFTTVREMQKNVLLVPFIYILREMQKIVLLVPFIYILRACDVLLPVNTCLLHMGCSNTTTTSTRSRVTRSVTSSTNNRACSISSSIRRTIKHRTISRSSQPPPAHINLHEGTARARLCLLSCTAPGMRAPPSIAAAPKPALPWPARRTRARLPTASASNKVAALCAPLASRLSSVRTNPHAGTAQGQLCLPSCTAPGISAPRRAAISPRPALPWPARCTMTTSRQR